ncbi:MAG: M23 family metallopeptidase [Treponema sp.]|nr:M23 family metallopeptidase [Treponema sp.]
MSLLLLPGADEGYSSLPRIANLNSRDTAFVQYLGDVENSRRRLFLARERIGSPEYVPARIAESLTVYTYIPKEGDDLLSLAARCNIPYGTIASLNRFVHPEDLAAGKVLLLPSMPGIFIPEEPETDLERLFVSSRNSEEGVLISLGGAGKPGRFRFIPGDDLTSTERVFFLNRGFRFPLRHFTLTSPYGPRVNPVTGRYGVHQGVDLAAPEGSPVYAAREGIVRDLGEDPVYGKYIIIGHNDNWVSLYGHLSKIEIALREELRSGSLIGRVGSSGQSTGPHLHFELRQNGRAQDPGRLLRIFSDEF